MLAARIVRLLAVGVVLVGCASSPSADVVEPSSPPVPSWILDISPPPGSQWELDQRVEVTFDVPQGESVRLLLDGTDVTDDAELGDGQLTYDAQQAPTAVALGSGEHTATVERVRTGLDSSEQDAVLDTFTWTFDIP